MVLVSPWANPNSIDHTLTNQTSVIRFIEDNWQLGNIDGPNAPPNGQASFDRNAGTLMNLFNFEASPSTDTVLLNCNGSYLGKHQAPPATCP